VPTPRTCRSPSRLLAACSPALYPSPSLSLALVAGEEGREELEEDPLFRVFSQDEGFSPLFVFFFFVSLMLKTYYN